VSETLRDDRHVDAGREHDRRLPVPEVVQPHPPQPGFSDESLEGPGDDLGLEVGAVLAGEDQVVLLVRRAERCSLRILLQPVGDQRAGG
jgi:hypothetical protein